MTAHFLENAQNLVISNSCFVDNSMTFQNTQDGAGLRVLLEASVPEAAHDSAARYPPPRCHPETRKGFIQEILSWAQPDPNQNVFKPRLLWLNGPAGVGKSAIAQTTAELLGERLGAAFFFSRLNHRDDANRLLPSIAYQLATSHAPYRKAIDTLLHNDPTLVSKSIRRQFQSLIIIPSQLEVQRDSLREKVIIIDGLDECQGNDYQRDIIDVIAASIRDQSTPFIWAIISRPEPHLVASFTSLSLKRFCRNMEVTVSRDNDDEMRQYLGDGLGEIQHLQGISAASEPWFTEEDLQKLIDLAAGLFIYAATVLRFINQPSPLGPEGQLRIVLALHERYQTSPLARSKSKHPLSELDLFYMLIMQRIPTKVLPVTMKILLAVAYYPRYRDVPSALKIADILGLSEPQFTNALCQNLQSVLTLVDLDISHRSAYFDKIISRIYDILGQLNPWDHVSDEAIIEVWNDPSLQLVPNVDHKVDRESFDLILFLQVVKEALQKSAKSDVERIALVRKWLGGTTEKEWKDRKKNDDPFLWGSPFEEGWNGVKPGRLFMSPLIIEVLASVSKIIPYHWSIVIVAAEQATIKNLRGAKRKVEESLPSNGELVYDLDDEVEPLSDPEWETVGMVKTT
ncbi:hypothetical protein AN958_01757 [Leucoagaricus sp. SymC.cos]|nr:hypothetical protein AN958_01757 [Leucoagaricus sp. SymC.cos]